MLRKKQGQVKFKLEQSKENEFGQALYRDCRWYESNGL